MSVNKSVAKIKIDISYRERVKMIDHSRIFSEFLESMYSGETLILNFRLVPKKENSKAFLRFA